MRALAVQTGVGGYLSVASASPAFGKKATTRPVVQAMVAELVRKGTAEAEFFEKIKTQLERTCPKAMLKDLQQDGYHFVVKHHVADAPYDTHPSFPVPLGSNTVGGLHSRGQMGNWILLGQYVDVSQTTTPQWQKSRYWKNALIHETGHAVATMLGNRYVEHHPKLSAELRTAIATYGISELPLFKTAWQKDVDKIPPALKSPTLSRRDGSICKNRLFYFITPFIVDGPARTRQEAFAEAMDVVLRGEKSLFNHRTFNRHMPNTLKATRKILNHYYGINA